MAVLAGLQPQKVFQYFEALCGIPHGSYNTKPVSDYCVRFAQERGLRYIQDEANNVIIFKDGTSGYEASAPVILQGHLDMVCEKESGCGIDFLKDGLTLRLENGIISADGTTLGGDDGIAVAYGLALLDADDIPHPPLEVIFTTDEEVGMLGADVLDCSSLKGRIMLNMDSEEEGFLLVGCAGGVCTIVHLPIQRTAAEGQSVTVSVCGLRGGHSGVEIDKGRANASVLLARLLNELSKEVSYQLVSVAGGLKDNAIPREASAELVVCADKVDALSKAVSEWQAVFSNEYRVTDPDVKAVVTVGECGIRQAMAEESKRRVLCALLNLPNGIQSMSADIPGLVQTSLNMGILTTEEEKVNISFALRSSVSSEKVEMNSRIQSLVEMLGGTVECFGDYPAWEYRPNSPLRDLMSKVYEEQTGTAPVVQTLHAGLECGLFSDKLPGLDCVSFGPNMTNIHTPQETLDAASVERTWKYLLEILKRLK